MMGGIEMVPVGVLDPKVSKSLERFMNTKTFFLILTCEHFIIAFRDGGRERENHRFEREALIACLPVHTRTRDCMPRLGIEPVT